MKKIMQGGILLILLGASCADSKNIIPSVIMIAAGILMTGAQVLCTPQEQ